MYKTFLIFKYLRKRRIAWVSLAAVTLCTTMVLVVISVMGGWLRMFRETNHALVGDIVISRPGMFGFAHYEEMIDDIQKLPEVKAAAPLIDTYGLADMWGRYKSGVEVIGLDLKRIQNVNGFVKSLHLQPDALNELAKDPDATPEDAITIPAKAATFPSWDKILSPQEYRYAMPKAKDPNHFGGIIVGSGVILHPDDDGKIVRPFNMYRLWIRLTSMKSTAEGAEDPRSVNQYWIIDDSHTGVYATDAMTVYVPFDDLQQQLDMQARDFTDAAGNPGQDPARCNSIELSLKDGFSPDLVKPQIEQIVQNVLNKYPMEDYSDDAVSVETWEESRVQILSAVEHEKGLLVILFAIISIVAIFLIFCIFFMIVVEKTRDIGIIKSVGATGTGVAAIFLGYGFVIGVLGAGMGLLCGYLVVHNINQLHSWLHNHTGITIWNAKTYVFDTIPNTLERSDVIVIVTVAILSSVLGAIVPAIRAARLNPVEALRWE